MFSHAFVEQLLFSKTRIVLVRSTGSAGFVEALFIPLVIEILLETYNAAFFDVSHKD